MPKPELILNLEVRIMDHDHVYTFELLHKQSHRILALTTFPKEAGWLDGISSFCRWAAAGIQREMTGAIEKWVDGDSGLPHD